MNPAHHDAYPDLANADPVPVSTVDRPEGSRPAPGADAAEGWSLAGVVFRQALAQPQALALATPQGTWSYAQLARYAGGLGRLLMGSSGWPAANGEVPRVGILGSRSAQACVAVLGASWAGATYVPLGLKLPEDRLIKILSRCRLTALIADEQGAHLLSDKVLQAAPSIVRVLGSRPPPVAEHERVQWLSPPMLAAAPQVKPRAMHPEDLAYIMFTSGTTGEPKGVMVSLGAVSHYVRTSTPMMGLVPQDRVLDTFELSFDVSVQTMFCTWQAGASLHMLPATRVMGAVSFVREQGLTVWFSVPSLAGMLRQVKALVPGAMPGLRLSVFGGEPLTRSAVEMWKAAAPHSVIYNQYGPTEATVFCLMQRVDQGLACLPDRDNVSIGQPMPGTQAAVLDENLHCVPDGQTGELALAGEQLAVGYLDAPEQTAARFVRIDGQRWYRTGDLAVRDAAGRFYCLGRLDNQVKVMGHRIELEDVDAHLQQVAGGTPAASVAWPLVDGVAQGLVAFIGGSQVDAAGVLKALKARLPAYMVPSRVIAIEQMPLNGSGKVDRHALRQLLATGVG